MKMGNNLFYWSGLIMEYAASVCMGPTYDTDITKLEKVYTKKSSSMDFI